MWPVEKSLKSFSEDTSISRLNWISGQYFVELHRELANFVEELSWRHDLLSASVTNLQASLESYRQLTDIERKEEFAMYVYNFSILSFHFKGQY